MSRYVKEMEMQYLRREIERAQEVLVCNVVGMDGHGSTQLRADLRKKGIQVQVVKNKLLRRVLLDMGLPPLDNVLVGSSALVWGGEGIVELAREISDWAKKIEKFSVKGACVSGQGLDAAGVERLTKLPSRLELLSMIVGQILGPGGRLAAQLKGPGGALVSQVKSIAEPKEKEEAAPA